jgi:hypothetical protein
MALEGDVVPSRVPAPLNITQIGGYLNLLTNLKETAMRSRVLAGILGVASNVDAAEWLLTNPPLGFQTVVNDRPAGPAQATIPVTVPIRANFAYGVTQALKYLHDRGCVLPLLGNPAALPTSMADPTMMLDPMPYLGRVLTLCSAIALTHPATDALLLARTEGSTDAFQAAANSINPATVAVAAADYDALQFAGANAQTVPIAGAHLVYLNPVLAAAGFYPANPLPLPGSPSDTAWAQYTNITGLITGKTRLSDELALLYSWKAIGASIFSNMTSYVWNGSAFAAD